jgi:hypothetical protein
MAALMMSAGVAAAQATPDTQAGADKQPAPETQAASPQRTDTSLAAASLQKVREARYQIGQMERLLEGAVEHGASIIRDRLQAIMPADMLLTENARARGFRLDGYGVFFDVEVPSLEGTLPWSFRTLDQNDLGLDAALRTLRAYVQASGNDVNVQQALKRIELQVAPMTTAATATDPSTTATAVQASGAAAAPAPAPAPHPADPVLNNPNEEYRTEIREALVDAMLEHSRSLGIGPGEWLTVAARRTDDRPRLGIDTDARTVVLSVRGADLDAFLSGQLSPDEARKRIEVRVF